jgi:transposase-like protein
VARPTALTPQTESAILEALKHGATMEQSAMLAGVDPSTLRRWRRKGESAMTVSESQRSAEERRLARFCAALSRASVEGVVKAQEVVYRAFDIEFETATMDEKRLALSAATWFLVRRCPEEYHLAPRRATGGRSPIQEETISVEVAWRRLSQLMNATSD